MSQRQTVKRTRARKSSFFLTIARGNRMRCVALPPAVLYVCCALVPVAATALIGLGAYYFLHDDLVVAATIHQAEVQYDYEDQIAALRAELDHAAARRRSEQTLFAQRVRKVAARQAQLESRIGVLNALAASPARIPTSSPAPRLPSATTTIEAQNAAGAIAAASHLPAAVNPALPKGVSSFAPVQSAIASPPDSALSNKPRPGTLELRSETPAGQPTGAANHGSTGSKQPDIMGALDPRATGFDADGQPVAGLSQSAVLDPNLSPRQQLAAVQASLDRLDAGQVGQLASVGAKAAADVSRLSAAIEAAGLSPQRFATASRTGSSSAMGGPYIPVKFETLGADFADGARRDADEVALADRLAAVLPSIPLRKPLVGEIEVTSPFGPRLDPFLGKMALHPGVDLRDGFGTYVHATAAGTVASAGGDGGYGNMVEIDHGHGLITRYAHLSAILVSPGEPVTAGTIVGRLGSTGRSTGPHLHYEVRVDGEPVDPMRFLHAGASLLDDEP